MVGMNEDCQRLQGYSQELISSHQTIGNADLSSINYKTSQSFGFHGNQRRRLGRFPSSERRDSGQATQSSYSPHLSPQLDLDFKLRSCTFCCLTHVDRRRCINRLER